MIETVLERIAVALEKLAASAAATPATTTAKTPPKTTDKPTGPAFSDVQDKVRELAEADTGNAAKIKALNAEFGVKRAGELEGSPKLQAYFDKLCALGTDAAPADDDLL